MIRQAQENEKIEISTPILVFQFEILTFADISN
ncbi:hypothetical protein Q428_12255 [Fervidicella metallireducens AeB]|uniref:Uncharacterized protein n=1 Tax=Fervidicella metallireducens AeB TaxID=1403537 RepID=A0A017RT69_9CLOT|nr:hypothetical protein Q428_12255 [Fervidicella metallireducens AeB]